MGFDIENWDAVTGALYMGAGTNAEVIWTLISALVCVWALILGSRHELDAYKKAENDK